MTNYILWGNRVVIPPQGRQQQYQANLRLYIDSKITPLYDRLDLLSAEVGMMRMPKPKQSTAETVPSDGEAMSQIENKAATLEHKQNAAEAKLTEEKP